MISLCHPIEVDSINLTNQMSEVIQLYQSAWRRPLSTSSLHRLRHILTAGVPDEFALQPTHVTFFARHVILGVRYVKLS